MHAPQPVAYVIIMAVFIAWRLSARARGSFTIVVRALHLCTHSLTCPFHSLNLPGNQPAKPAPARTINRFILSTVIRSRRASREGANFAASDVTLDHSSAVHFAFSLSYEIRRLQ